MRLPYRQALLFSFLTMKKLLAICFVLLFVVVQAQIKKVEPAFWWKGMTESKLQILLYGDKIASYQVELSEGLAIEKVEKVENPNYLFVTVDTDKIDGRFFTLYLKKAGRTVDSYKYELKERQASSRDRRSFSSKDVVYLIMPDRFANGDESNDSVKELTEKADRSNPNGRHGGDLRGIINNLDYLHSLGATALWLTPANQDNEKRTSYHGYAQTDLYQIDRRYGTNEEYVELSNELQKRGMLLIQDYVTNHWGISHWMIQDLPSRDWIHQFEDGEGAYGFKRSNYRTTTQLDPNASDIDTKGALNGWFDTTMPDLNQSNPFLLNYLKQNAIWWIEYANLGGMRVDTYPYNNKEAMAEWVKAITKEYPHFNVVGEAWMYSPAHIAYWQKDSPIAAIDGYNSNLPSVMDFTLYTDLSSALKEQESGDKGMVKIYNALSNDLLYTNVNNIMVFFENHDTERWNEIFESNPKAYQMALTLVSTIRGIPQIYYGSEIGMRGKKSLGDADIRHDFPGGWKEDSTNAFISDKRTVVQKEFYEITSKILNWRKSKDVVHNGKTTHYMPENGVYVYFRYNSKDRIMVVLNNSEQTQKLSLSRFAQNLEGSIEGTDVVSGNRVDLKADFLEVSAKTSLILEIQ